MSYFPSVRRLIITGLTAVLVLTATGGALGAKRPKKKRPGCRTFCQQAGGVGAGPGGRQIVTIRRQHLEMTSDGVVFMRATCDRRQACVGAILLDADSGPELGRSDLRISGRTTTTVGVSLSARGVRYVRRHDDVRSAAVIVLTDLGPVSFSAPLTVSN